MGRAIHHSGGRLTSVRYGEVSADFERDGLGRETKRYLADAGVFEQAYDSVGRLVNQAFRPRSPALADAASSAGIVRHFGFDERGFLGSIEDSLRRSTRLLHDDRGDLQKSLPPEASIGLHARARGAKTGLWPARLAVNPSRSMVRRRERSSLQPVPILRSG